MSKVVAKATAHFTPQELACNCCGALPNGAVVNQTLAFLERVRALLGNRPITITSGFRCAENNRAAGGAKNSQHLLGTAADIRVHGLTPEQVQSILREHRGVVRGLGLYDTFTHVDRRERVSTWEG